MNNTIYNSNSALFFVTVLFSVLCFSPKVGFGQQIKAIDSEEFFKDYLHLLENGETLIIDGRTRQMFSTGYLKNAINIDADDPNLMNLLQPHLNEPQIVVYCTTVRRTIKIVNTLIEIYDGNIIFITDGIRGWRKNGYPYVEFTDEDNNSFQKNTSDTIKRTIHP